MKRGHNRETVFAGDAYRHFHLGHEPREPVVARADWSAGDEVFRRRMGHVHGRAPSRPRGPPRRPARPSRKSSLNGFRSVLFHRAFPFFPVAPIANGWSETCRVGIAPAEDQRLCAAQNGSVHLRALIPGNTPIDGLRPSEQRRVAPRPVRQRRLRLRFFGTAFSSIVKAMNVNGIRGASGLRSFHRDQ
jgi:hypothetical protein